MATLFAAALASFHLRIPVVHVEAGLRTNNNLTPFPEELNRQLLSCIACFHLAPTSKNLENLVRENIPISQIMVTGNTGIDALEWAANLDQGFEDKTLANLCAKREKFIIVTAHRRENWGTGIEKIIKGLKMIAKSNPDLTIVVPQHPNEDVRKQWQNLNEENVYLTEPLSYPQFAKLMKHSSFVITDSGGIQEEAPSLNKPVLVVRSKTEREEGIHAGTLKLVGTDPEEIMFYANRLLKDKEFYDEMALAENPYGDGESARRIVEALENLSFGTPLPTSFGSIYSPSDVIKAAGYSSEEEPNELPVFNPEQFSHEERSKEDERVVDPIWPSEGSTKEHDIVTS